MITTLSKTKVELALAADFAARSAALPGSERVAAARADAMASFERLGLPHRRVEAYKYTDLRVALREAVPFAADDDTVVSTDELTVALGPLAALDAARIVFVNGRHSPQLSSSPTGFSVTTSGRALRADDTAAVRVPALAPDDAVLALNAALATDGAIVVVETKVTKPLLIVEVTAGATPKLSSLRHHVTLRPGTSAMIIEARATVDGAAAGQANTVTEVAVGDGASLQHAVIGVAGADVVQLRSIVARLGDSASLHSFQLTVGVGMARTQSFVKFLGENAKLDISGLMLGRGRDHIDTTLVIDHATPRCESRELFKAVLDDQARAVFQGKVIVRPDAQKTDGKQMAKALMLSEVCEFDAKPELEIYADDVVCGHGATVAEIDPAMLFYLRSRGIPEPQARALLIESFVGEALDKIVDDDLRDISSAITRTWLLARHHA